MTYIWEISDKFPEDCIGLYNDQNSLEPHELKAAVALESIAPLRFDFDVSISKLLTLDDLANSALVPLISKRLAELLVDYTDGQIQLLKALVVGVDGAIDDYRVLNTLFEIDGIDFSKSNISYIHGTDYVMGFESLALKDSDFMGALCLAREVSYPPMLYVSQLLGNMVLEAKFRGFDLKLNGM
ncbi:hypothetical protein [Cerasicoccus frondis]|uniref:hypothetical protein n=1 Tax=Cerasicoccus frondis TaxID=490090 RepID=UPI002852BEF0|nr:hypothetical protein [Cerasicoccus frondis]